MHQICSISTPFFLALTLFLTGSICAQLPSADQSEPNLEITLYLIVSGDAAGGDGSMPARLIEISRQLESSFGTARYRVADIHMGRTSGNGVIDSKSVSTISGKGRLGESPSFIEWHLGRPKLAVDSNSRSITIDSFRFGIRMPVRHRSVGIENDGSVVSYERLGITTSKLKVEQAVPTLVGTITLPQSAGSLFLVIVVSRVQS